MPSGNIESIRRIIRKLSAQEVETIRLYIGSFNRKFGDYTPKTLVLFDAISDNTEKKSLEEIKSLVITEEENDNTFIKLISRLREKIYEGLTLDVNLKRPNTYSKAILSLYQLRKNNITAQILYTRGLVKEAVDLIAKSERIAVKYHYYNELFSLLSLKLIAMNFTFGAKKARQVEKDIMYYRQLRAVYEKSELYFNSLAFRDRKQANTQSFLKELLAKIDDLASDPYLHKVDVARYYLGQLMVLDKRLHGKYEEMEKISHELVNLVKSNPYLQNRPRLANSYKNLADASLFTGKYDIAREYASSTQQLLLPYSQNYFELELFFFYTYFYDKNYQQALKQLQNILRLARQHPLSDKFYIDKLHYMHAYTLLMLEKYSEANRILLQSNELMQDKEGWNISVRILQVMIRIGQLNYNKADSLIESLYHYVSNPERKKLIKRRDYLLCKLLYKLMQKDYNFKEISSSSEISALEKDPELQWRHMSPELIPVNMWLKNNLLKSELPV